MEMKPRFVPMLERCIEEGIELSWNRAHKHTDSPTQRQIRDHINQGIWLTIHEWFYIEVQPECDQSGANLDNCGGLKLL